MTSAEQSNGIDGSAIDPIQGNALQAGTPASVPESIPMPPHVVGGGVIDALAAAERSKQEKPVE